MTTKKHYCCKNKCSTGTNLIFFAICIVYGYGYFSLFSIATINEVVAIKKLSSHNLNYFFHMDTDWDKFYMKIIALGEIYNFLGNNFFI